jgi:hypothetical protein
MSGKRYYVTTREAWQKHAARFVNSHWIELPGSSGDDGDAGASSSVAAEQAEAPARILLLVEGDEGAHLALEDDPAFEQLPHPLARKRISGAAHGKLAQLGVKRAATTFDVAELASRVHPLLRHRVF